MNIANDFFSDVNSAKSLCNTTVVNRVNTLNLIFTASRSHQPNNIKYEGKNNFLQSNYTCSCNVTGIVKLNVRDIRLHAFQNGSCPSAIANASSICDSCDTVKSNCTHRFKMNTLVSDVAKRGFIFLTGLSSLYSPSFIWVQVLKKGQQIALSFSFT